WGTALAKLLHESGHTISLWGHNREVLAEIQRTRRNERYLPGIPLPEGWNFEPDAREAIRESELVVVAVPSNSLRDVTQALADFRGIAVTVTKGIEYGTCLTMTEVLQANAPHARVAALSGPTLALEVARGIPAAIVAASADSETAKTIQTAFHRPTFRVYTSSDIKGVELGGALKNVIAIAA